jgi:hypothetical protein
VREVLHEDDVQSNAPADAMSTWYGRMIHVPKRTPLCCWCDVAIAVIMTDETKDAVVRGETRTMVPVHLMLLVR